MLLCDQVSIQHWNYNLDLLSSYRLMTALYGPCRLRLVSYSNGYTSGSQMWQDRRNKGETDIVLGNLRHNIGPSHNLTKFSSLPPLFFLFMFLTDMMREIDFKSWCLFTKESLVALCPPKKSSAIEYPKELKQSNLTNVSSLSPLYWHDEV